MRVLIADDSLVFRSQIKAALDGVPGLEVVGVASNGRLALEKMQQTTVDLVILDMEMPELSGLETIKEIKQKGFNPKILVFSSYTTRGSSMTLEALALGAHDFVTKPQSEGINIENAAARIREELLPKVLQFENARSSAMPPKPVVGVTSSVFAKRDLETFHPQILVIGSSTGGPPALEAVLQGLSSLRVPVLIVQHMPPIFTASLAKRLSQVTELPCNEAKNGELVEPGHIYVAPGNYHLSIARRKDQIVCMLDQSPQRNSVRPAVDTLFESAAELFGSRVCAVVLTGMGEDGRLGCLRIKKQGGGVLIQDRESSVVFGMPGAVFSEGAFDYMGNLAGVNRHLRRLVA